MRRTTVGLIGLCVAIFATPAACPRRDAQKRPDAGAGLRGGTELIREPTPPRSSRPAAASSPHGSVAARAATGTWPRSSGARRSAPRPPTARPNAWTSGSSPATGSSSRAAAAVAARSACRFPSRSSRPACPSRRSPPRSSGCRSRARRTSPSSRGWAWTSRTPSTATRRPWSSTRGRSASTCSRAGSGPRPSSPTWPPRTRPTAGRKAAPWRGATCRPFPAGAPSTASTRTTRTS